MPSKNCSTSISELPFENKGSEDTVRKEPEDSIVRMASASLLEIKKPAFLSKIEIVTAYTDKKISLGSALF